MYNTILAALYCTNIVSVDNPEPDMQGLETSLRPPARFVQFCSICLRQGLYHSLQPDDVMLLLQWALQAGCLYIFISMFPLLPRALKPPTSQLLDLLEENKAQISCTSGGRLLYLLSAQHLSAMELLSALELFADDERMVSILSYHPAAAAMTSAEVLGALRRALKMGDTQHFHNLCRLPAAHGLAAADLAPILASAAASSDNNAAVFRILEFPAAQDLSAANVTAVLKSAAVAGAGYILAGICKLPAVQQLSGSQVAALLRSATVDGSEDMISCLCWLPAAQRLPPLEVAAVLQLGIENGCSATGTLCLLPGATQMGASQVEGLLVAATDAMAAQMDSGAAAWLTEAAMAWTDIMCIQAA